MGAAPSFAPLSVGKDSSIPNDLQDVYSEYLEEESLMKPFTSSLFKEDPSSVEHKFEWPDNNFIVDLLLNPEMLTKYKTPKEVLDHIIVPLFCGDHSTMRYYHQLVLQFFEFAKHGFKEYSRKYKNRSRQEEQQNKECVEEIVAAHFQENVKNEVKFETVDDVFNLVKKGGVFVGGDARAAIPFMIGHVGDAKSVFCSIMLGFYAGDVTPILAALPFLAQNPKLKMGSLKFVGCGEWMRSLSLNNVGFVPMPSKRTKITKIMDKPAQNVSIAANGRYVYVTESRGSISVLLRGRRIQRVQVSSKEVVFACSNGMLYVTDFEKDYVYQGYPMEKLDESNKVRIVWPFCSDGQFIYSMTKPGKKIRVMVVETPKAIKEVRSVELLSMDKKTPVLSDFDVKSAFMYSNGPIVTLFKESCLGPDRFEFTLRHYSLLSGQHIDDFQFKWSFPINSVVYDPYDRCFYGLSVFEGSTQLLHFPCFGGVPPWIAQLDYGHVHTAHSITKKFESAKTGKDVLAAVVEFLRYYVSHSLGFSFESLIVNHLYTTHFGNFLCPMTHEFFSVVLDILESTMSYFEDPTVPIILLSLLQMNLSNYEFRKDVPFADGDRILSLFGTIVNQTRMVPPQVLRIVVFTSMNAYITIFRQCWDKGELMFKTIYQKSAPALKLFVIKNLARKRRLVFCITSDMCEKLFSLIFENIIAGNPTSLLDAELVDCFLKLINDQLYDDCAKESFQHFLNINAYLLQQRKKANVFFVKYSATGETGKNYIDNAFSKMYGLFALTGITEQQLTEKHNGGMANLLYRSYDEFGSDNYTNKKIDNIVKRYTNDKMAVRAMNADTVQANDYAIDVLNTNDSSLYGMLRGDKALLSRLCIIRMKERTMQQSPYYKDVGVIDDESFGYSLYR